MQVRLRIDKLHDIESARNEFLRHLKLSVNKKQTANGLLDKLDELLPNKSNYEDQSNGGQCPVFISYETENETAEIRLGSDVSAPLADEDIKKLKKALGEDRVNLIY